MNETNEICVCGHLRSEHQMVDLGEATNCECKVHGCDCHLFYRDQRTIDQFLDAAEATEAAEAVEEARTVGQLLEEAQPALRRQDLPELQQALLNQLRSILSKPFNAKTLNELERTARLARQLLVVSEGNGAKLRRSGLSVITGQDFETFDGDELEPADVPPAETFGSASIRELVSAMRERNKPHPPDILTLVEALGVAKREGLTEVAQDLERQIKERQRNEDPWVTAAEAENAVCAAAARPAGGTPCGGDL